MSNEIQTIVKFFKDAKPNPTIEDACVQIGCHYEEVAEMAEAIGDESDAINALANDYKSKEEFVFQFVSHLKLKGSVDLKTELLDSLCDQIVTAVGTAQYMGFDIVGALNEVIASNDSKFEDGKPVFNEQGKITKGKDYFAPNLEKFI